MVCEPEHVKFAFICDLDEEEQRTPRKERIPVSLICEVLDVSRGGFYAWLARAESDRATEDAELTEGHCQLGVAVGLLGCLGGWSGVGRGWVGG